MTFTFQVTEDLRRLARHAMEHHAFQRCVYTGGDWGPEEKPAEPALMLVKDRGAYLMSPFTSDGAPANARLYDGGKPVVVYAHGCGPDDEHIGGDDFGADVPGFPALILRPRAFEVGVRLSDKLEYWVRTAPKPQRPR